jgi:hypothetical protein
LDTAVLNRDNCVKQLAIPAFVRRLTREFETLSLDRGYNGGAGRACFIEFEIKELDCAKNGPKATIWE